MSELDWRETWDEIHLAGLKTNCVVGIYPRELLQPQPLVVHLTLYLDTRPAVRSHSLTHSVDYAALSAEVQFILEHAHFKLLETAAEAICHYITAPSPTDLPRGQVAAVKVTLEKPEAICHGAVPSLTITRTAREGCYRAGELPFGQVLFIHESPDCQIYRLCLPAGGATPLYSHVGGLVADMPYSHGALLFEQPLSPGVGLAYPEGFVRRYSNHEPRAASLLCVAHRGVSFATQVASGDQAHLPTLAASSLPQRYWKSYYKSGDLSF